MSLLCSKEATVGLDLKTTKWQMKGKGTSFGHSQPRPCSGRKTLKRCQKSGEADNVVLIDVDSDSINNVIIIDVPESLPQKLRGSSVLRKDKKWPLRNIICIDDDESTDNHHPGLGVKDNGKFYGDASSSRRSFPASNHSRNSVDAVGDECQFVQENVSPLKLSKCKRTYSGKASIRNRYGLSTESESGSSDNDCPDFEFMEDSFGKLREQWEKASLKKKYDVRNSQSGMRDEASASRFFTDTYQNVGVENKTEQDMEAPVCSSSSSGSFEEEAQSPFIKTGDSNLGSTSQKSKKNPIADTDLELLQKLQSRYRKADIQDGGESFPEDPSCNYVERQTHEHFEFVSPSFHTEEEQSPRGPSLRPHHEQGTKQVNHVKPIFQDKEKTPAAEPSLSNSGPSDGKNCCLSKSSLSDEEASSCKGQHSVETNDDHGRFAFRHKDENFQQTPRSCDSHFLKESHDGISFREKEKFVSSESSVRNTQLYDETHVNHIVAPSKDKVGAVPVEALFCENPSLHKSGISIEKGCPQQKVEPVPEESSFWYVSVNETQQRKSSSEEVKDECVESMSNSQQEDERENPLHVQDGDVMPAIESCVINDREKLKETDEYKRAIEEEWASRQRELQIQAEEAQQLRRLHKRKKAESMRLLDMERRQKQRVEEIRETQKKDEENMNLKDRLRAEVRNELNKLETTCPDMASLLRGLGIDVNGGLHPFSHEVRAAYKKALLSFHPDRASRSDLRQEVEAEEKFKLISRMKEKFLSTS